MRLHGIRLYVSFLLTTGSALCLAAALTGCETSSHKSIRTYEYSNEPVPQESAESQDDGEWHMVSPGEMTSPGKMVNDPG